LSVRRNDQAVGVLHETSKKSVRNWENLVITLVILNFDMFSTTLSLLWIPATVAVVGKNGVGRLPALGFNSWNAFHCNIDETKFLDAANKMVSLGLKVWIWAFHFVALHTFLSLIPISSL
jgi:hypothetical protein